VANLLSGLFGALLATALGAVFAFWVERVKVRSEVMLTVVGWAD
jgi:predicted outer membrane lipoprotein